MCAVELIVGATADNGWGSAPAMKSQVGGCKKNCFGLPAHVHPRRECEVFLQPTRLRAPYDSTGTRMPWKSVPHAAPLTTTARGAFVQHHNGAYKRRTPIIPKQQTVTDAHADVFTSTYRTSFGTQANRIEMREPIIPSAAFEWPSQENARSGAPLRMPRSTSQDAFVMPVSRFVAPPANLKPPPKWASVPNVDPLSSTSGRAYVAHGHLPRPPIGEWSGSKADLLCLHAKGPPPRSTSSAAFVGITGRASTPIFPRSNGRMYGSDIPATFETTSGSAFVGHPRRAYVAAIRPVGAL